MLQALDRLRRTDERAGAAAHDVRFAGLLVDLAQSRRAADRADSRGTHRASLSRGRLSSTTARICGMTSPARCTTTVSPTRTSLRAISSSLCRVALETTTPPTVTGFSLATGVSAPVRPTLDLDRLDDRRRLLGGELVRGRPARAARDEAEPLLQREIVDLVDDAVDVVAERRRAAPRSRGNARASPRPNGRAGSADWSAGRSARKASIAPNCVVANGALTSPQA